MCIRVTVNSNSLLVLHTPSSVNSNSLVVLHTPNSHVDKHSIARTLPRITYFNVIILHLTLFLLCTVADDELMEKVQSDISSRRLNEVCIPMAAADLAEEGVTQQTSTKIRFFEHSDAVEKMLQPLSDIKESHVFNILWRNQASKEGKIPGHIVLSLEDVAKRVWQPVYSEQLPGKADKLGDGSITLREVEQLFNEIKDQRDILEEEVRTILNVTGSMEQNILDTRLQQIEDYYRYQNLSNIAAELVNVRDAFSLEGDFAAMETLSTVVNKPSKTKRWSLHWLLIKA